MNKYLQNTLEIKIKREIKCYGMVYFKNYTNYYLNENTIKEPTNRQM